ncbi:MAG: CHAP domain-containing protein [Bacteroidetes bacterium]|nr:CHAP domain-containing protein [Bacteroidota bacterium]
MRRKYKLIILSLLLIAFAYTAYRFIRTVNPNNSYFVGQKLDSLNHVYVFYNGGVGHTGERNISDDGYNIGLTYQCVEFVKRYYYQHYHHKMPDSYGNAKDFFDASIKDGALNSKRNLLQFTNPAKTKPMIGDLLVFDGHAGNKYGHVAIVSKVSDDAIEIIQQNPGPFSPSRVSFDLVNKNNKYEIKHERLLGWLRMKEL